MNILDTIMAAKRQEVMQRKRECPVKNLEQSALFTRDTYSLAAFVRDAATTGIIAEFKRKSPSRGTINSQAEVRATTQGYVRAGAAALSVLTDEPFFGGCNKDLIEARVNSCPILRKDFVMDEYQIVEARSIGADAVLLIAAVLTPRKAKELTELAHTLALEVVLEVHDSREWLEFQHVGADVVGVNNRSLKTFGVSVATSIEMANVLPQEITRVSESGIDGVAVLRELKMHGYHGFLMGEHFMKHPHPELAALQFMNELREG